MKAFDRLMKPKHSPSIMRAVPLRPGGTGPGVDRLMAGAQTIARRQAAMWILTILYCLPLIFMAWTVTWGTGLDWTGHTGPHFDPRSPIQTSLYRADRNMDEAWEAFHQAALGGTLASPAIQTQIERDLHESRLLLVDARKAAQGNDHHTVSALTVRIEEITTQIKEKSRRRKP